MALSRRSKFWLPVLLWMAFIFLASTDAGSTAHTSRIIGPLLRLFKQDVSPEAIEFCQTLVRKSAHLTEYAILGLLLLRAIEERPLMPLGPRNGRAIALALLGSAIYAGSDEFHQRFVASRESSVRDVLVDTAGAASALGILQWAGCAKRPRTTGVTETRRDRGA